MSSGPEPPKIYLLLPSGGNFAETRLRRKEIIQHALERAGYEVLPGPLQPGKHRTKARLGEFEAAHILVVVADGHGAVAEFVNEMARHWQRGKPRPILPIVFDGAEFSDVPLSEIVPLQGVDDVRVVPRVLAAVKNLLEGRQERPQHQTPQNHTGRRAYISEAALTRFRGFRREQTLQFRPAVGIASRWTVILGDNGTGKTTLLRALAACCADAPQEWRSEASECRIKAAINWDTEAFEIQGAGEQLDDWRPLCFGYGAGRRAVPARLSSDTVGPTATLFDDKVDLPDAEEWFLQTDHAMRVDPNPTLKSHYERVKAALVRLLPDVTDIKVETHDQRTRVAVEMHGEWFPMSAMSLGYKTALTWMVDLAQKLYDRFPDAVNPLAQRVVVLIDEIDLHLHPRWQRALLEVLTETFEQAQFIVTAHSPLIVQAAPDANLVLLRREGDSFVIDNDVDYVRQWRIDQILASELFGGQPVHSVSVQKLLDERAEILRSDEPDTRSERLQEIDAELKTLPTAVLPEDQEAMDIVRDAAEFIRAQQQA